MNIIPTTSVNLPLGGEVNELSITVNSFNLFPDSITITWKVIGESITREGTLEVPKVIIDNWGTDDSIIKEFVLQELNLIEL